LSQQGPQGRERREHQEGCNGRKWLIAVLDGGSIAWPDLGGKPVGHGGKTLGGARDRGKAKEEVWQGGQGVARVDEWGEGYW